MSSSDYQMYRNSSGRLPYLTRWSRHEPASIGRPAKGATDHWTKSKHKNVTMVTIGKDDNVHCFYGNRHPYEEASSRSQFIRPNYHFDGTMQHNGTQSFTQLLLQQLNGNWPGDYHRTRPHRPRPATSVFGQRAKEGFEYWYKEPVPVNPSAKNWIGAGGSVLGTSRK